MDRTIEKKLIQALDTYLAPFKLSELNDEDLRDLIDAGVRRFNEAEGYNLDPDTAFMAYGFTLALRKIDT